jgi:hypothetical protein
MEKMTMTKRTERHQLWRRPVVTIAALLLATLVGAGAATAQEQPMQVTPPQPTVPEVFTLMGEFVRVAYNNEGYATLGYRLAQEQIGKEWMMLQFGVTLRKPTPPYRLKREDLSITTPDGTTIPLATQPEYAAGGAEARSLTKRAQAQRDSINYFPVEVDQPCTLQFFADPFGPGRALAYDTTELSFQRACVGRLFFKVPGGIKPGQHWLNVKFAGSSLQVPFRALTEEEEKQFRKTWKDFKKQHEAGYKK